MKKLLFKLIMSVLFAGVLFSSSEVKSQTAGIMTFSVNLTPHNGQYSTNNNNGQNHYTVIWVQSASGNFVKTLYRGQLGQGKDVWEHCQVWVATNTTSPYGNVVDAVTSATLLSYAAPVTATWNGSDTTNPTPFKLLPDGNYRVFIETAWTATYIMYAGRDTASFAFTKGPSVATTTFPSVTNFSGASVTWTPAAMTNTVTTSAVAPTTYVAGASMSVPFTLAGAATLYTNNVWTAQLSDAAGSFTNPVAIGTAATPTAVGTGTVSATIPAGTLAGTGYRIRAVGNGPGTIGTDNGANITITNGTSPALTAAAGATVDNPFNVTFADDATWRAAITAIKVGGTTLTAGSAITAGQITFTPAASIPANLLQLAGTKGITVIATGYGDATVNQAMGVGAAANLVVKTQPVGPISSGTVLATQPAIYIQDQYNNLTGSTATVNAAVGTGAWTLGGTTAVAASAGTATFTNLTATSVPYVAATLTFTCGALTSVSSNTFYISGSVATGTVTVGAAGDYTSFTRADGLFNAINTGGITGNITANVISDVTNEDGTVALKQWYESGAGGYTLKIQPTGGASRTLSGTLAGPLFNFNGADHVTIDGLNTGGNALTISNLSTSSAAGIATIKFTGDATNNIVTNCTVLGSGTTTIPTLPLTTDGGTIYIGTGVATGNDNITISNCKIGPAGTNLPSKGIYANGSIESSAKANSNITVTNCEIYDFSLPTSCAAIEVWTGNTDWSITNNKIYQTAARTYTVAGTMYGIYFISPVYGDNVQITGNTIGYASSTPSGTYSLTVTSGAFNGIAFATAATATTTCNVSNNIISDISITATTGAFVGINSTTQYGVNTVNVNNNQIKNIVHNGTTGAFTGMMAGSAGTLNCTANTIDGITKTGTTGAVYGIRYNEPTTVNCTNNIVRNIAYNSVAATGAIYGMQTSTNGSIPTQNVTGNSFYNITTTSTAAQTIYGWNDGYATANGTKTIQNNNIYSITAPVGSAIIYGIKNNSAGTVDISGNKIYTLSGGAGIYGITVATGTNNVYKNKIYDLSTANTSTTTIVYGINAATGTTHNIFNNYIGGLRTTAANAAMPIAGIYIAGTGTVTITANVYYNTVYLNATSTGALFGSSAIYASTIPTLNLRNNIFVNTSTAMGAGITAAYCRSNTTLTTYASTSNNNLFYTGTPSATNLIMYDGTNSYQTLAAYKIAMATRDAVSITENPNWVSTTGANATYLHINTITGTGIESGAVPIATYTDDYDGDVRNPTTPDIGADEFAGLTVCAANPVTATVTPTSPLCNGGNGSAIVAAGGGTGPYAYSWSSGSSTSAATGLAANNYTVTITDVNSCIKTTTVTVIQPSAITTSVTATTNVSCFAGNTGSAAVTAGGGTPAYTYLWSNGSPNPTAGLLTAGVYTVTVKDANNCSTTGTITITQPAAALTTTLSSTNETVTGNGAVSAAAGGGTSPYKYNWLSGGQTTASVTGLVGGTYTSTVTDANGCTSTATVVVQHLVGVASVDLENSVVVYPNPNSGEFNLTMNSSVNSDYIIELRTVLGQVLYSEVLTNFIGKYTKRFDVKDFGGGIYFMSIRSNENQVLRKVMVY